MTLIYHFNSIIYFNSRLRRRPLGLALRAQPRSLTQTFPDGFACIWIHPPPHPPLPGALSDSILTLPSSDLCSHWHSLKQPPTYIYFSPPSPSPPTNLFSPPRKHHSLSLSRPHNQKPIWKWAWIRIGLSIIASPATVKLLAAPTALKSAAWATSKRRLVPHQNLPLPPVLDNPPSGHHQWAQANPASIYNRQSTLASTGQIIHSPRLTHDDPSPSMGPLTSPLPSRLRPLQFLSLLPPPPPSKPWRLLHHNPLSLRCRAKRRQLLGTVASRRKRRLSSGTTPTHSIFYGFGREGWILHNQFGSGFCFGFTKPYCWLER